MEGVPTEKNETSDKMLRKVTRLCGEAGVNIPDTGTDRAHRISVANVDKKREKSCKSIIVRFTTFYHRIMVYRAKKNMKDNVIVKLDRTKNATI